MCTAVAPWAAISACSSGVSHTQCPHDVPGTCKNPVSIRCFTADPCSGKNCFAMSACALVSRRWTWPSNPNARRISAAPRRSSVDALYAVTGPTTMLIPFAGSWNFAAASRQSFRFASVFAGSLAPLRVRNFPPAHMAPQSHPGPAASLRPFASRARGM